MLYENDDFHETIVKPLPKSKKIPKTDPQIGSIWPQGAPKTVLKRAFSLLEIDLDFESFWDRFGLHFDSPNVSLLAPFRRSNVSLLAPFGRSKYI